MKKLLVLIITITTLFSCANDECGLPNIPSQNFTFEIVEKTSGENVFTNGTYKPEQIQITNTINNFQVPFTFLSENNVNHIQINSSSWESKVVNLKFDISDTPIFNFYSDGETIQRDCFSYTEYNEITIEESEFELDIQTGVYKILVE